MAKIVHLKTPDGDDFALGDDIEFQFTITVPVAATWVKAWLYFKRNKTDDDADAIVALQITSGFSGTTTVTFTMTMTHSQSSLFSAGSSYYWALKMKSNTGAVSTAIRNGHAVFQERIIDATS